MWRRMIRSLDRIGNIVSHELAPRPLFGRLYDTGTFAAFLVVALVAVLKCWLVLSGAIEVTQSDGSSRLYYAISRYEETGGLWSSISWTDLPLPVPQIFYVLLYKLDVSTGGLLPVLKSVLLANIVLFAGGSLVLVAIALRWMGSTAAFFTAILTSIAKMPAFVSTTEAVEPSALLLMAIAFFAALEACRSPSPQRWAFSSGLALMVASLFRIELALFALPLGALLYHRIGFARTCAFVAMACSYLVAFNQLGPLLNSGSIQYSDLKVFYNVSPLSPTAFLKTALFERGMLETWAPHFTFWLAILTAVYGLLVRQARIFSLFALFAVATIVFFAIGGRVVAAQPRYAVHATMLLALPVAYFIQAAVDAGTRLAPAMYSQAARAALIGGVLILFVPSLNNVHAAMHARSNSPAADFRRAKNFLVANLKPGERILADHSFWHDYYFALHAMGKTGAISYSYLARCCVSERAKEVLGTDRLSELTRWKNPILGGLDAASRYQAFQVYGQGFIAHYRPRYLVVLAGSKLDDWRRRLDVPKGEYSVILGEMRPAANVGAAKAFVVTPRYATLSFCAIERFKSSGVAVLEAFYPAEGVVDQPAYDLCMATTAAKDRR